MNVKTYPEYSTRHPLLVKSCMRRALSQYPDDIAIVYRDDAGQYYRFTWRQWHERTCQLAHALKELGVQPGEAFQPGSQLSLQAGPGPQRQSRPDPAGGGQGDLYHTVSDHAQGQGQKEKLEKQMKARMAPFKNQGVMRIDMNEIKDMSPDELMKFFSKQLMGKKDDDDKDDDNDKYSEDKNSYYI